MTSYELHRIESELSLRITYLNHIMVRTDVLLLLRPVYNLLLLEARKTVHVLILPAEFCL